MNKFERVLVSSIYKRKTRNEIRSLDEYNKQAKLMNKRGVGGICEIVGLEEFQVKPYFDIDVKRDLNVDTNIGDQFNEKIIDDIENDIQLIFNGDIYKSKREARTTETYIKYSYRLYLKARISYANIPVLFETVFDKYDIIDKSV